MHLRSLAFLLLTACAAASAQAAICRAAPTASGSADGATWADASQDKAMIAMTAAALPSSARRVIT